MTNDDRLFGYVWSVGSSATGLRFCAPESGAHRGCRTSSRG
jgi:hypothetical protein